MTSGGPFQPKSLSDSIVFIESRVIQASLDPFAQDTVRLSFHSLCRKATHNFNLDI